MNSETKIISIIGVITVAVIIFGMTMAGKAANRTASPVAITQENLINADSPRITGSNPKLQIVEFADFECPACAAFQPELKRFLADFGDQVDFVFRVIPIHSNSKEAAAVAYAAGEQGKFKEMHDMLFENQSEWTKYGNSEAERKTLYEKYATNIGLDIEKYKADVVNNRKTYDAIVNQDEKDAQAMNISSTPTIVVNGQIAVRGVQNYNALKALLDQANTVDTATTTTESSSSTPVENLSL